MRDHCMIGENGERIPVSKLPTFTIVEILLEGAVHIEPGQHEKVKSEDVIERLRTELLIRELNL